MTKGKYCRTKADEDDKTCSVCGATDHLEEVKNTTVVVAEVEELEIDDIFLPIGIAVSFIVIVVIALLGLTVVGLVGG